MHNDAERIATFQRERPHLLSIAFRILGSQPDAEDAVQETWIKFAAADSSGIRNVTAWLTTVVTRVCVDSLRRRRDVPQEVTALLGESGNEPEETALLADELTAAFVVVLGQLTPPQRVALVLHDAFGVSFDEIAHILDTTAESAKKLASRARGRVRQRVSEPVDDTQDARRIVEAFLHAAQEGNTDRLIALLDPNVVRLADPHVLPPRGEQRIQGVDAVVAQTLAFRANAARARLAVIDGRPGIVVLRGDVIQAALVIRVRQDRITEYDVVADPQRLAQLEIER